MRPAIPSSCDPVPAEEVFLALYLEAASLLFFIDLYSSIDAYPMDGFIASVRSGVNEGKDFP